MSARRTSPHRVRPGSSTCPGFSRKNVTVQVACTTGPALAPVLPSRPLGTSTATTGLPAALMAATTSAAVPSSGRDRPAPNRASMTRSASASVAGLSGSTGSPQRSAMAAASPRRASRLPSRPRRTWYPCSRRSRAATKPSPPLLPGPHTTAIAAPARGASAAAASATARPAFSISVSPGTPCAMARASARPISCAVSNSSAKDPPSPDASCATGARAPTSQTLLSARAGAGFESRRRFMQTPKL